MPQTNIEIWLDFAMQQMASESYLHGINLLDNQAVIGRLIAGNNAPGVTSPKPGATRFADLVGVSNANQGAEKGDRGRKRGQATFFRVCGGGHGGARLIRGRVSWPAVRPTRERRKGLACARRCEGPRVPGRRVALRATGSSFPEFPRETD